MEGEQPYWVHPPSVVAPTYGKAGVAIDRFTGWVIDKRSRRLMSSDQLTDGFRLRPGRCGVTSEVRGLPRQKSVTTPDWISRSVPESQYLHRAGLFLKAVENQIWR